MLLTVNTDNQDFYTNNIGGKSMRDFLLNNLTDLAGLSLNVIILNNIVAVIIGLFIMFVYRQTYTGVAYSKRFNVSVGTITVITTLIMAVISNNIALSLGMVGALSIIRFRTPVKDPRDIVFIFWAVAVGVACGVSQYMLAGVSSIVIFSFLIMTKQTIVDGKQLIIIKCTSDTQNKVHSLIDHYLSKSARLRMKNVNKDGCEMIYEVSNFALQQLSEKNNVDLAGLLLKIDGVENVNQVEQSDDISR